MNTHNCSSSLQSSVSDELEAYTLGDVPRACVELHGLLDGFERRLSRARGCRLLLTTSREHAEADRRGKSAEGEVFAFDGSAEDNAEKLVVNLTA